MRETRNCFECGTKFNIENKADLDAYELSGLCPNCRAEVFEDMYSDEIKFQLKRIADTLELFWKVHKETGIDVNVMTIPQK